MEYEIELKLLTDEDAGGVIESKLLPQLNAKVLKKTLLLANYYFDTPDRLLRQHDIGLRIRGNGVQFEQTLKTSGISIGGLHQRPEYNVQLGARTEAKSTIPDLKLFPQSAWPEAIDVSAIQAKLETLFTTHFERKVYVLEFPSGDIIEMVWDLGKIISGNKSTPICELELELKRGASAVIFELAALIVKLMPTAIGTNSKAARGYYLLDGAPKFDFTASQNSLAETAGQSSNDYESLVSSALRDFQMLACEIRCRYSEELATHLHQALCGLAAYVKKFNQLFPCLTLAQTLTKLEDLIKDWPNLTQQNNKDVIYHLLTHADTTQMQLNLVQSLVERPWSK